MKRICALALALAAVLLVFQAVPAAAEESVEESCTTAEEAETIAPDPAGTETEEESGAQSIGTAGENTDAGDGNLPEETLEEVREIVLEECPEEALEEYPGEAEDEVRDEALKECPEEALEEYPAEAEDEGREEALEEYPGEAEDEVRDEALKECPEEALEEYPAEAEDEARDEALKECPEEALEEYPAEAEEEARDDPLKEIPEETMETLREEDPEDSIPEADRKGESEPQEINCVKAAAAETVLASGSHGSNLSWKLTKDGVLTLSGTGEMKASQANGYPWKAYEDKIKKIVMKEGITSIAAWAFSNLSAVESASLPGTLTHCGYFGMRGCSSLSQINIPEGVEWIEDSFLEGTAVKKIVLPSTLTRLDNQVFMGCGSLQEVTVLGSLKDSTMMNALFKDCTSLKKVVFSDKSSFSYLASQIFSGCSSLESVTLPSGIATIKDNAFEGCSSLKDVWYDGTFSQWCAILRPVYNEDKNQSLYKATIHCKSGSEEIVLNRTSAKPTAGKTVQLSAGFKAAADSDIAWNAVPDVTWTSSDKSVAAVSSKGVVTGKKYGKATITAKTAGGKKASCKITVLFKDVTNPKASCFTPVYWAVDNGITRCTTAFHPSANVTRGEFVAFLYRMSGSPAAGSVTSKFRDVTSSTKFAAEITWAVKKGVIKGFGDGTFRPEATLTRSQCATMIWRWAGKKPPKTTVSPFSDVKKSSSDSFKAILWGSENGIIKGSNGKFLPNDFCQRQHVVIFLYRYAQM